MGSFGERMQREREMRGITLEEIAESTKIGTRSLRALEAEDFEKLPGGIFNKGFVRAYAKYLGIDEEQAVTDFMAALDDYQKQLPASTPGPAVNLDDDGPPSPNLLIIGAAVALLIVVVAIWSFHAAIGNAARGLLHRIQGTASRSEPTVAAAPKASPTPATAPGVATGAPDAKAASGENASLSRRSDAAAKPEATAGPGGIPGKPAIPGEFELRIHTRQDAWVSITADDQVLMEGVLKGDKTVRARSRVVFRTGNAGAVEVSFNGQPQPPLGAENQVKTVVFTADGMQR